MNQQNKNSTQFRSVKIIKVPPVLSSLIACAFSGLFLYLLLFFFWHTGITSYQKAVIVFFTFVVLIIFLLSFYALIRSFLQLPARKKLLFAGGIVTAIFLISSFTDLSTVAEIVKTKFELRFQELRTDFINWKLHGKAYVRWNEKRGVYKIIPYRDGFLAMAGYELFTVSLEEKAGELKLLSKKIFSTDTFRKFHLKVNPFTDCAVSKNHLLWCIDLFGDVFLYDGNSWEFVLSFPAKEKQFYDYMAVDEKNDYIYAITCRGKKPSRKLKGLWAVNLRTGKFYHSDTYCYTGLVSAKGKTFAVSYSGLYEISETAVTPVISVNTRKYSSVEYVEAMKTGEILIATQKALLKIKQDSSLEELYYNPEAEMDVRGIAEFSDGSRVISLWEEGLLIEFKGKWTLYGIREGMWRESLRNVFVDAEDHLWVASSDTYRGLTVFTHHGLNRLIELGESGKREITPYGIFQNVAIALQSLSRRNLPGGDISQISVNGIDFILFNDEVVYPLTFVTLFRTSSRELASVKDKNNFVIFKNGIIRGKIHGIPLEVEAPVFRITKLFLDRSGEVWVGTVKGLFRLSGKAFIEVPALKNSRVTDIVEDKEGQIYVAVLRNPERKSEEGVSGVLYIYAKGIWKSYAGRDTQYERYLKSKKYDPATDTWTTMPCTFMLPGRIHDLEPLQNGGIGIATDNGFTIYRNGKFRCFSIYENLPDTSVIKVHQDHQGRIWLITYSGNIFWFKGLFYTFHMFDKRYLFSKHPVNIAVDGNDRILIVDKRGKVGVYPVKYFY